MALACDCRFQSIIAAADLLAAADSLATAPFRGESRDDLLPGLRHLALDRAVYWFRPRTERILALLVGDFSSPDFAADRVVAKPEPLGFKGVHHDSGSG